MLNKWELYWKRHLIHQLVSINGQQIKSALKDAPVLVFRHITKLIGLFL